jgi:hypothetical protein
MPVDLTALRTEIESNPQGLGYAPLMTRGSDADVADLLNAPRSGAAYIVFRPDVPVKDVVEAITAADFGSLTAVQCARLQLLFVGGTVDVSRTNTRQALQDLFSGASNATKAALLALVSRSGSRAEKLFGVGTTIHHLQVAAAFGRGTGV